MRCARSDRRENERARGTAIFHPRPCFPLRVVFPSLRRRATGHVRQDAAMTNRIAVLILVVLVVLVLTGPVAEAQQAYEGQIDGTFEGWTGETIYKLMDGHIIQQSEYHYHY